MTTSIPAERASAHGEESALVQEWLRKDLVRVREALQSLVAQPHSRIEEPIAYAVEHSGRLLRPTLVLLSSYLLAEEPGRRTHRRVIEGAAVVETLHIATLHHDDVIDSAQVRRGRPSINAKYGTATALLTGDYLLARCMQGAAALGRSHLLAMAQTLADMCVGQMLESSRLHDPFRTEPEYYAAVSGKTARLLRTAASMGVLGGKSDKGAQAALESFGNDLGMAFQIWDDILDICSTETGKEPAKDILNGVYTLPVIYAVQDSPDVVLPLLSAQPLSADRCRAVVEAVHASGAIARAAEVAQRYTANALLAVESHPATAAHAPLVRRCLRDLVGTFASRHPALGALRDATGPETEDRSPAA
ncbi:polyprenyl synthetase family protein [Kitasatospora purpeofusca]|uniref:polyprenyl synthetase family protein n=1 Tax=Kitasatospora purpeofusca TaxID=67352 RepID=UPI0036EBAF6A